MFTIILAVMLIATAAIAIKRKEESKMKRRKFLALTAALVLAATTGLASCGNNSGSKGDTKELNMILYPDYVPQSVIDSFEKKQA